MNLRPHPQQTPELNLTPLVDVVFLLLLFFMVSTTFEQRQELPIALPEADGQPIPRTAPESIVITIDRDSVYTIGDSPNVFGSDQNARERLLQALTAARADNPKRISLLIEADAQTPHQAVMRVLDVAQELDLTQIAFATRQAQPEAATDPEASTTP